MHAARTLALLGLAATALAVPAVNTTSRKHCTGACQHGDPNSLMKRMHMMQAKEIEWTLCAAEHKCPMVRPSSVDRQNCENNMAGEYRCDGVDLLGFVSLADMGIPTNGNDIWGWTDPETGHEIAIAQAGPGTAFVDVTNPTAPVVLGMLPTHTVSSSWRDAKVYQNHVFIGSEASNHGIQILDLTTLRTHYGNDKRGADVTILRETNWYGEHGSSHNMVLNEETGYLYSVGSGTCSGGLHIIDVREPANPQFVGCYAADGYTHDAECVVYRGPDAEFQGNEICFNYNENTLTIVDVTDKSNMVMLGRVTYDNVYYTHQGWLFAGQTHLLLDDELDEQRGPTQNTRTMVWDVTSLRNPTLSNSFFSEEEAIDHNQYIKDEVAFQANYCAGLRILKPTGAGGAPVMEEVGYLRASPDCNTAIFRGAWSVYPYFASGNIIMETIERGLFIMDPSAALARQTVGAAWNGTEHLKGSSFDIH